MRIIEVGPEGATVELTLHELIILNNAMNETLNAISEFEFSTRVGATTSEVETLLEQVYQTIGRVEEASTT